MTQTVTWEQVCENNDRFRRLADFSGMPILTWKSHRLFTFLPGKGTESGHQAAINFAAHNEDGTPKRQHHFITLGGDPGLGKTHLALGIGWHWLENGMGTVKYWQAERLLDDMRENFEIEKLARAYPHLPLRSPFEQAQRVHLLIIDDLGAEKATEWANAKLDELIDCRYIEEKPTVFTTNLLFSQLPKRLASRLQEGVTVMLEGPDYRKIKAQYRQKQPELKHDET